MVNHIRKQKQVTKNERETAQQEGHEHQPKKNTNYTKGN